MKDDVERMLNSLTPRGAAAGLRDQVLGAVAGELAATVLVSRRGRRWDVRIGAAVAVSLVLGVVLNLWAIRSDDARQARLFGPSPLPREIRETIQTARDVAGPECAELVRQQLVSAWRARRREDPLAVLRYREEMMQFVLTEKGYTDVAKDPGVDRRRIGRPDRSAIGGKRDFRVA